jgi:hypothetical protein
MEQHLFHSFRSEHRSEEMMGMLLIKRTESICGQIEMNEKVKPLFFWGGSVNRNNAPHRHPPPTKNWKEKTKTPCDVM